MFGPYRQLAAVPGLLGLLTWSLLGRLHLTGTPLAMAFLVAGWTGSYIPAGVIGGAYTVGVALGGPLRGRSADRGDPVRILLVLGTAYATGMVALAFAPSLLPAGAWPLMAAPALVTGLLQPPVTQISRAAWPRLTEGAARESLFTVEATLQEVLFVVGPVLTAMAVAVIDARAAVLLCGGLALSGAVGFAAAMHRVGLREPVPVSGRRGSVLGAPGVPVAILLSLCLIVPLTTLDMMIVAWAREYGSTAAAGVLVAVWAIGSMVGGLVAGARTAAPRLARRVLLMAVGILALVPVLPPVNDGPAWLIGAVLAVGGLAIAPALATTNSVVGALSPPGRAAETFGWLVTAATLGSAATLPMVGWLLDHLGPAAVAAAAGALALAAAGLAVAMPKNVPTKVPVNAI
ncbi:MFS transporter [Actinokineospora sp.]|uniref:MFS transporter n=1 Tax=Actinokineospora sp. TaxID=1872133 RepID=UPI004038112F